MAFFNKSTQMVVEPIQNEETVNEQQAPLDITQLEKSLYELAAQIQNGTEKNRHLIEEQQKKLDELKNGLQNIELMRNGTLAQINAGGVRDSEALKQLANQAEEHNGKMREQQGLIDRIQLDISLLQQERDPAIDTLLQQWQDYEKQLFSQVIFPLESEVRETKEKYFTMLKELRFMYTGLERLSKHINESVGDGDKVFSHTWFHAIQMKPELQITKYDEQKEEVITHSYLAE